MSVKALVARTKRSAPVNPPMLVGGAEVRLHREEPVEAIRAQRSDGLPGLPVALPAGTTSPVAVSASLIWMYAV